MLITTLATSWVELYEWLTLHNIEKSTEVHISPQKSLEVLRSPQKSTEVHKSPQKSAVVHRNPQKSTGTHRTMPKSSEILVPQKSIEIHRYPQKSIEPRRNPEKSSEILVLARELTIARLQSLKVAHMNMSWVCRFHFVICILLLPCWNIKAASLKCKSVLCLLSCFWLSNTFTCTFCTLRE